MSRALSALFVLMASCEGVHAQSGASEPIVVEDGTFQAGELISDENAPSPLVLGASSAGFIVTQGAGNIRYTGLASTDAYSVGVEFPGVGTGYWVVPVQGPDPTQDNNLLFGLTADFKPEVPYGLQSLRFVAFDADGVVGPSYDATLCVLPASANGNLAACDPGTQAQSAVLSLSWDTEADLDLVVVTPEGKVVSAKAPTTAGVDGDITAADLADPTTGYLSRDSNANCVIDGIRRESLIFPGDPPPGDYAVYASLFSPCGEATVSFHLDLYQRTVADDGTQPVVQTDVADGQLLALQADGGTSNGLYLSTVTLP